MRIEIPNQLKQKEFKFCTLTKGTKKSNQNHNVINYQYDNKYFLSLVELNCNYGVLCGYGNLLVVDIDNEEIEKEIKELKLPKTFCVLSAIKKKPHLYFRTQNEKPTLRANGIDLQGKGSYIVGSNSLIETSDKKLLKYEILEDIEISFLSDEFYNKLVNVVKKNKKQINKEHTDKRAKPQESHYLDKKDFVNKEINFVIDDIIRINPMGRYDIKVSNEKYKEKSFDLNKLQMFNLLKKIMPNSKIKLSSEYYKDEKTKKNYLRWKII